MTEQKKIFLDDLIKPYHKYGEEWTPGGRPRYVFWFGQYKEVPAFVLWKFNTHKAITDPPECIVTSFTLAHFVKAAKAVGLHISKADQRQLEEKL